MKTELRWTREAAADLENIANYLFENTPERAAELVREIYDAPTALSTFPNRGRMGKHGSAGDGRKRESASILW